MKTAILLLSLICASAARLRIVNVVVTYPPHHPMVRAAAHSWRHGYEAVVVTEAQTEGPLRSNFSRERWYGYPDDLRGKAAGVWKKGDAKLAAALRVANESLSGEYDWLTYGDDDTYFLMHNVERLVEFMDSSVPFILSDTLNFCSEARCARQYGRIKVCSLPGSPQPVDGCSMRPAADPVLGCTPKALSAQGACGPADTEAGWYGLPFPCGRNGALFSRGLLHTMTSSDWRTECELPNTLRGGGELRVYNCLRDRHVVTDPTSTGASWESDTFCSFGFTHPAELLTVAEKTAQEPASCDERCHRILFDTISVSLDHVGGDTIEFQARLTDALHSARRSLLYST